MLKYEIITDREDENYGHIRALIDLGNVKKGDLGGRIDNYDNLSQEGDCWVYVNAQVRGDAEVLDNAEVFPKTESGKLETLVGVGGSPQSVVRAAAYDFPLVLAIIGGSPERFAPYVELYRRATAEFGREPHPVGMHSPGLIADTDEEAVKLAFPWFKEAMDKVGKTRGWQPMSREHFLNEVKNGSMYVGSPETVARKIAKAMKAVDAKRFDMVYGFGPVPADVRERMIELYATKVIPRVRELLSEK